MGCFGCRLHRMRVLFLTCLLIGGGSFEASAQVLVSAERETQPVPTAGDSLTDVALWVNSEDAQKSLILVTDVLSGGVFTYGLDGGQMQQLPNASVAVDVRQGLAGLTGFDALVVVVRVSGELEFFKVQKPSLLLEKVNARSIVTGTVPISASFHRSVSELFVFVAGSGGVIQQWRVNSDGGTVDAELARTLSAVGNISDVDVDEAQNQLWAAVDTGLVWKFDARLDGGTVPTPVASVADAGIPIPLRALTLYAPSQGGGHWVLSSGEDRFSVFSRSPPHAYLGQFRVVSAGLVDGVSICNGVEASAANLGAGFSQGTLLALDGLNDSTPNAKLISWSTLAEAFVPPLDAEGADGGSTDGGVPDGGLGNGAVDVGGGPGEPYVEKPLGCNCQSATSGDMWLWALMAFLIFPAFASAPAFKQKE